MEDVFSEDAQHARLRDVSGFEDAQLVALLENLKAEAARPVSSELFVRGIAQAIAVHLARNYTALTESSRASASALHI